MKKRDVYIPYVDMIVTIILTCLLIYKAGLNAYNGGIYVFLIYVSSILIVNWSRNTIIEHNKNLKKHKNHIRKSMNDPNERKKEICKLEKWYLNSKKEEDITFQVIKFVLGFIVMVLVLGAYILLFSENENLHNLTWGFYVDLFLFPTASILLGLFSKKRVFSVLEYCKNIFYKDGKLKIVRGVSISIGFIFMVFGSIFWTIKEWSQIGYFMVGVAVVVYMIYTAPKFE